MNVIVSAKAAKALRRGFPWVYRQDIETAPDDAEPGAVVEVKDAHRNAIGHAFWASQSPIAVRMLGRENFDAGELKRRLEASLARRASLLGRDAYRVVHGEADRLPGLLVDRYGPALSMQCLSEGMDVRKQAIAKALIELTGAKVVVCRDDGSGRDFEKLAREKRVLEGSGSTDVRYHEGPNVLRVDLLEDAKTGSFLDQVDNHLRVAELASGEALDTFSYHGGFALSLSRSCREVLAVEQEETAAARAKENAAANGRSNVTVQHANAFDVLKAFDVEGRRFDTVVLDPPGLLKRKEGPGSALRAYHELNLRALRILRPEGLLVTCSCSGKLSRDDFEEMLFGAATDAKRQVQVLERRGAGIDHPALFGLHETEYLKCYCLRVLA